MSEGWHGWDEYAPFYDWENAQTLGRRDVPFWTRVAKQARGPVLELGCGTGRISLPLARAGVRLVGIDRSSAMLAQALRRAGRLRKTQPARRRRLSLIAVPELAHPIAPGALELPAFEVEFHAVGGRPGMCRRSEDQRQERKKKEPETRLHQPLFGSTRRILQHPRRQVSDGRSCPLSSS